MAHLTSSSLVTFGERTCKLKTWDDKSIVMYFDFDSTNFCHVVTFVTEKDGRKVV